MFTVMRNRKERPEEQNCWSDREGIRTARGTAKRNGRKRQVEEAGGKAN